MSTAGDTPAEAISLLRETETLRQRTRQIRRTVWFPLAVFGAITVGSAAFCQEYGPSNPINIYWLATGSLGYLACLGYYRRRERSVGVGASAAPYAAAGLILLLFTIQFVIVAGENTFIAFSPGRYLTSVPAVLAAVAAAAVAWSRRRRAEAILAAALAACAALFLLPFGRLSLFLGHALMRNALPVIVAAIALLVLAWFQRSVALGAVAVVVGVSAGLSDLYFFANRFHALPNCSADFAGIGAFMLAAGGAAALIERKRR